MYRVAVCDDEPVVRDLIKKSLDDYSRLRSFELTYDEYVSGKDLIKNRTKYGIIILDYHLSENNSENGLAVAKQLRKLDFEGAIIFLTGHPRIVFSSFEVETFRFLVKPLEPDKLFKALDDYVKVSQISHSLIVRIDGVTMNLNTRKILFVEGDGKHCVIHMQDKELECHETLMDVESRLPAEFFVRCHRSYLINMAHVGTYGHDEVALKNGEKLYISRQKYRAFHDAFMTYNARHGY